MTTVKRRTSTTAPKKKLDLDALVASFKEFRAHKNREALEKKAHEKLRDEVLMPALVDFGQPHGDKGQHLAIPLPDGVEVDGLRTLVRRKNVSRFINVDRAEEMATAGKYLEDIQNGVVQLAFVGSPAEARKVYKLVKLAGLLDEEGVVAKVENVFSQERLMAFHQRHRDKLTEADLDSLFDEDVTYAFFPER